MMKKVMPWSVGQEVSVGLNSGVTAEENDDFKDHQSFFFMSMYFPFFQRWQRVPSVTSTSLEGPLPTEPVTLQAGERSYL